MYHRAPGTTGFGYSGIGACFPVAYFILETFLSYL